MNHFDYDDSIAVAFKTSVIGQHIMASAMLMTMMTPLSAHWSLHFALLSVLTT